MLYICGCTKIGHHNVVDILESEQITSKFDTFSVVSCDTFYPERSITNANPCSSSQRKSIFSRENMRTLNNSLISAFLTNNGCHLGIVKDYVVTNLHHFNYFWKTYIEVSWSTKSLGSICWYVAYFDTLSELE